MAAERNERKVAKSAKSKLSKPNPKQKQVQYRIEIGSSAVKVLRVDAKGKIIGSGVAQFEGDPLWADMSWVDRLSQTVKVAAREARVPKGSGFPCSVVINGPNLIMQRFTWPELNHKSMLENAKYEIASYLPGAPTGFVVGAEVQKKNLSESGKVPALDVFVAAAPKDMATAVSTAISWAGFKVVSIDVSENVRARLIKRCCVVQGGTPSTYGVLDLSSDVPNITLYLDGFFYSTQHFSTMQSGFTSAATLEEMEAMKRSGEKPAAEHDVDAISREISFVADFIKYQERTDIEAILIMGKTQSGFAERLSTSLDIPVYNTENWLRPGISEGLKGDPGAFLDAYASGLPSAVIGSQHMLDLKVPPVIKNPKARLTAITAACLIAISVALAIALFIPYMGEQSLKGDYRALDDEDNRIIAFVAASPTVQMIEDLNSRIDFMATRVDGIDAFYEEFAQAAVVVPVVFEAGFSSISRLEASSDTVNISATATYYHNLADLLEHFRDHELFRSSGVAGEAKELDTTDWINGTTMFNVKLYMERRAGAIKDE